MWSGRYGGVCIVRCGGWGFGASRMGPRGLKVCALTVRLFWKDGVRCQRRIGAFLRVRSALAWLAWGEGGSIYDFTGMAGRTRWVTGHRGGYFDGCLLLWHLGRCVRIAYAVGIAWTIAMVKARIVPEEGWNNNLLLLQTFASRVYIGN